MSFCNSVQDSELKDTIACLRYLYLPSASSVKTRRSWDPPKIPPAAKLWKPGRLDKILEELDPKYVKPQIDEAERDFFCQQIPSKPSSVNESLEKTSSNCMSQADSRQKSLPAVKNVAPCLSDGEGRGKEERRRIRPGFNPPRQLTSSALTNVEGASNQETYDRNSQSSSQCDQKPILQVQPTPLFSTHRHDPPRKYSKMELPKTVRADPAETGDCTVIKTQTAAFKTANEQLFINDRAKGIKRELPAGGTNVHVSGLRKTARYEAPTKNQPTKESEEPISDNPEVVELMQNPLMKNVDPKMVEAVLNEVFDSGSVEWNDIAGLQSVKNVIKEIIIWPMLRPDIFTGLRGPPKGILLFGPPGTGKTMIGKLIATQSKSSFFNISASSLTSKWIGDGEKMVRALFAVARVKQPSVIFIDEIDSILTQRSDTEHESSRRLKTEFLIQFDGCGSKSEDRILIIGVTNRPQELDDAARRRLVKRIYIPLPDVQGRKQLVQNLLSTQNNDLTEDDYDKIANLSEGYSGADMASLCKEASLGPIKDDGVDIENICADEVRPMSLRDFEAAIRHVKASVDQADLVQYDDWDQKFGCHL